MGDSQYCTIHQSQYALLIIGAHSVLTHPTRMFIRTLKKITVHVHQEYILLICMYGNTSCTHTCMCRIMHTLVPIMSIATTVPKMRCSYIYLIKHTTETCTNKISLEQQSRRDREAGLNRLKECRKNGVHAHATLFYPMRMLFGVICCNRFCWSFSAVSTKIARSKHLDVTASCIWRLDFI